MNEKAVNAYEPALRMSIRLAMMFDQPARWFPVQDGFNEEEIGELVRRITSSMTVTPYFQCISDGVLVLFFPHTPEPEKEPDEASDRPM